MVHQPWEYTDAKRDALAILEKMRESARGNKRHEVLADQMEVLLRTALEPSVIDELEGAPMTKKMFQMLSRLRQARGKVVTKAQLHDAMYFERAEDAPEVKIVDVQICKMRKRLKDSRFQIETVWGHGYKLVETPSC